ncbi:MAG: GNAT family N-acetyltransferase [Candidatus Acidiferrales bacterium]
MRTITNMTAPREIITARLLLRSLEIEDIPAIVRQAGDREISSMTLNIPHPYREQDARDFLSRASEEFRSGLSVSFAICISPGGELCGGVGLNIAAAHRRAELGYWIGVSHWGKGYATEAAAAVVTFGFETLHLHRIYAHHFAGNAASGRVLEKIGMRHEGRSREHIRKWDRFVDLENYGLLEREYQRGA